jgi:hypothetical protein
MELKLSNNLALVATESHVKRMSPRLWMPLHQARLFDSAAATQAAAFEKGRALSLKTPDQQS